MTTSADRMFEDRLQVALQDLADDVRPAPQLAARPAASDRSRQARRGAARGRGRRRGARRGHRVAVWLRTDGPHLVEPVQRPPKVFRLSGADLRLPRPGDDGARPDRRPETRAEAPAYLVPARGGPVVHCRPSAQHLRRLRSASSVRRPGRVRQNRRLVGAAYVLVDLASGRPQLYDAVPCLALSPDGSDRGGVHRRRRSTGGISAPAPAASCGGSRDPLSHRSSAPAVRHPAGDRLDRLVARWLAAGGADGADTLVVDLARRAARRACAGRRHGQRLAVLVAGRPGPARVRRPGADLLGAPVDGTAPTSCGAAPTPSGRSAGRDPGSSGSPAAPGSQRLVLSDEEPSTRDVDALRRRRRPGRGRAPGRPT